MYKPSLGLGTKLGAAANKSDLNTYLKNLKKKQKELTKKHGQHEQTHGGNASNTEEEDSDLASIARELRVDDDDDDEEIFNSPFIKKPADQRPSRRATSNNSTPLPEKEFAFIGSSKPDNKDKIADSDEEFTNVKASTALDKFMRFDKKYKQQAGAGFRAFKKQDFTDDDSEVSEPLTPSPVKIVAHLEEKMVEATTPTSSHKTRLRRQAEQAGLKLTLPRGGTPGKSGESTTSEVSDHIRSPTIQTHSPRSPKSPLFSLENLHDIEELMEETNAKEITPDTGATGAGGGGTVTDNYFKFESPTKKASSSKPAHIDVVNDDEVVLEEDEISEEVVEIVMPEEIEESMGHDKDKNLTTKVPSPPSGKSSSSSRSKSSVIKKKPPTPETPKQQQQHLQVRKVSLQPEPKKRSKSRKKRSRSSSCYKCHQLCDYHLSKVKGEHKNKSGTAKVRERVGQIHEGVQVGSPQAGLGRRNHYMFDPTKDAMSTANLFPPSEVEQLAFIRSAWTSEIKVRKQDHSSSIQAVLQNNQNPMAYALSELIKGQLELTSSFLQSQKSLYASYCASLDRIVQDHQSLPDKVVYPKQKPVVSKKMAIHEEEASQESIETQSASEILEDYESEDFESPTNSEEDDDTIVPTEISVEDESQ